MAIFVMGMLNQVERKHPALGCLRGYTDIYMDTINGWLLFL